MYKGLLNSIIEQKGILASDPPYVTYLRAFNQLPKAVRKDAIKDFKNNMGRDFDGTSADDLAAIVLFGRKREEEYRKAFK